jgi:hypothetical protein
MLKSNPGSEVFGSWPLVLRPWHVHNWVKMPLHLSISKIPQEGRRYGLPHEEPGYP